MFPWRLAVFFHLSVFYRRLKIFWRANQWTNPTLFGSDKLSSGFKDSREFLGGVSKTVYKQED